MNSQPLVSIIVPVYNAKRFIKDTIESIQRQTYKHWELILIDDTSIDTSVRIIKAAQKQDERIILLRNKKNLGVAETRNAGVTNARGDYITFLDADDLWEAEKLSKQLEFMKRQDCAFSFTGYQFADAQGIANGPVVAIPATITYKQALKNTTIWTSTVMFDMSKIEKEAIKMPNIASEDMATWWRILRSGYIAYGLQRTLSFYRRSENTLSSNKLTAVKRTWSLYRKHEQLDLFHSLYYFCWYIFNATARRI